ncbi:SGNH/GDSL hydrolase family protein [Granulicoccus phenolivorans]|uniref:SGNH/GDSL hydrolase family protein n=1 Tax=Granulicoccus phenolivorans TaxID=266854 RepID=UPI000684D676|nr:SGNH/GDSL hydrolase family protein [Granulicoccus phenolivorans]
MRKSVLAVLGSALVASSALTAVPAEAASWNANYVAFGDSYAAGSNLPDANGDCYVSPSAYPTLLSSRATSVACSGATTADLAGQIAAARQMSPAASPNGQRTVFKAQQVTLTVGGNDVGWTTVLRACLTDPTGQACQQAQATAAAAIAQQPARTAAAVQQLRAEAPNAQILVTGYPKLFQPAIPTDPCNIGSGTVVPGTAVLPLDGMADQLNAAIAAGVAAAGDGSVKYVAPSTFDGHGICSSDAWITGLVMNGDSISPVSFHPNAAGQQAYAAAVRPAL